MVCLPNYNADGNDRIGRNEIHRPGQIGPSAGMGLRENAQQLDLNRDFIKIESPEARSLVKLIDDINPDLFIDCPYNEWFASPISADLRYTAQSNRTEGFAGLSS